jgi:hypothetical protein
MKCDNAPVFANSCADCPRKSQCAIRAEVAALKKMSTVEMMCENESVRQHVVEWENRCLKAEAEVAALRGLCASLSGCPHRRIGIGGQMIGAGMLRVDMSEQQFFAFDAAGRGEKL